MKQLILIADDDESSQSAARSALESQHHVLSALSGDEVLDQAQRWRPCLILLNIRLPRLGGAEVMRQLKSRPDLREIPVIFLSDGEDEEEGLALGAIDFVKKPLNARILCQRVKLQITQIEQKSQMEDYTKLLLKKNYELGKDVDQNATALLNLERAMIFLIVDLIEGKDGYTGSHVVRTARYMSVFMNALYERNMLEGIAREEIEIISLFSCLHDVGKLILAEKILQKTTITDVSELMQMRLHTIFGASAISKSLRRTGENIYLRYAMQMARNHHEWWDGSGYPDELAGEDIPFLVRILSICNAYDKIRFQRGGKNERTHEEAVRIIKNSSDTQFDSKLAAVFIELKLENK